MNEAQRINHTECLQDITDEAMLTSLFLPAASPEHG